MSVLGAAAAGVSHAADYSESVNGEISSDRFNPSGITLDYGAAGNNGLAGNNVISGLIGRDAFGLVDRDYFSVVVPQGFVLSEMRVGTQTTVGGGGSFIGLALGATMPVAADATTAAGLLGWHLYAAADRGTNILDNMQSAGNGAGGFASPLASGTYTFWVQELASGSYSYRFNLILSPVPEPSASWLLTAGLLLLAVTAARRR